MSRRVSAFLVGLLVVTSVGSAAGIASAAQTDIAIQSANTSVDQPAPGESFTVTTTIANLESSSGPVDITDVYVRDSSGSKEYARVEDVGSVSSGGTISVPLTMNIADAGEKRLTVHVVAQDSDGTYHRLNYPLYVDVDEPDEAAISFSTPDLVAGQESSVNVSVSNGDDGALSNVKLELGGDAAVENAERVSASIQSGAQVTNTYQVTFDETGEQTLGATLTYKTDEGVTRTITRNATVDVDESNVDAELTARTTTANGSSVIEASLTEYGNVELRDVQLSAVVDGETVARGIMADVPAEETRTVALDGTDVPSGTVTVVARYTAAGEQHTTERTFEYNPQESSNIALTGVEATVQESTVTLSGEAANLGSADADSVFISVAESDGVSPSSSNGEYFVGTIETSEFSTFELTATASGNGSVERVPVLISYSVDGERFEQVVDVDVGGTSAGGASASADGSDAQAAAGAGGPPGQSSDSGGILSALPMALGVVVIGAVGFGVYRWRQQS
ncbi:hypothetical protein C5B90_14300 [Haloferax sp. Atlit-12N]|uniref:hypothetical protein n=1 Tax=Haloferax sp. Atlit-12N TaxID=2077203 RepID=UPI000E269FE9|nr:hypothetical protein [Haloferax sp. Atlit-12N]RDZ64255.1 hypothetical protein C5B90_14300 [Haloferax sp. Atlit-12N]